MALTLLVLGLAVAFTPESVPGLTIPTDAGGMQMMPGDGQMMMPGGG